MQQAANLGGDADTIAAIVGGLAGVHEGYATILESHSGVIMVKDMLSGLAQRVYEMEIN